MLLRVGTRGSRLALAQTRMVCAALREACPDVAVEEVVISTSGDRFTDRPLDQVGSRGVFVREIEKALLAGRIDFAVHSLKDLPCEDAEGLIVAAIPRRGAVEDFLVHAKARSVETLPAGARIGTGSQRRAIQLRRLRADLVVVPIRGNVDTRLRRTSDGTVDAVVLARAGLDRLGLEPKGFALSPEAFVPAVGQGALALQARADDRKVAAILRTINDANTHIAVTAERRWLRAMGGGCRAPLAAWCAVEQGQARMIAFAATQDGSRFVRRKVECALPELAEQVDLCAASMRKALEI